MENIGRVLVKSIYHNAWVKIEYRNKDNEITKYMIGINDINPFKKSIQCDCFNIAYSNNTDERSIYFDSILAATICEHTYHKTP